MAAAGEATALLLGETACPALVILAPVKKSAFDVLHVGMEEYKLWFVCAACFRVADSNKGKGYILYKASKELEAITPSLQLGLKLALGAISLALKDGLKVPVPNGFDYRVISDMCLNTTALLESEGQGELVAAIAAAATYLAARNEAARNEVAPEAAGAGGGGGGGGGGAAAVVPIPKNKDLVIKATGESYMHLKEIIHKLDKDGHHYGVKKVAGGKCPADKCIKWVCPHCENDFGAQGLSYAPQTLKRP
jgi:hypothetical protein